MGLPKSYFEYKCLWLFGTNNQFLKLNGDKVKNIKDSLNLIFKG